MIYMRAPGNGSRKLSRKGLSDWLEVNSRWKGLPRGIDDMLKKVGTGIPPPIPLPPATNSSEVQPEQPDDFSEPPQMLPPEIIDDMKFSKLLQQWEGNVLKAVSGSVLSERYDSQTKNGESSSPWKHTLRSKAVVLRHMIDVIKDTRYILTNSPEKITRDIALRSSRSPDVEHDRIRLNNLLLSATKIEVVGLIKVESVTATGRGVLAVGVFSRGKLQDDSRGSLRQKIEELHGKRYGTRGLFGRKKKLIEAFSIEGLAGNTPGRDTKSAAHLLAKIEEYAQEERKAVLVTYPAYIGEDGTDLTEYYVRLGFVVVDMEDGSKELVYAGISSPARDARDWVDNFDGTIMVGFNLLTGS